MVLLVGCSSGRARAGAAPLKAECDQFAARAIQTPSPQEAASLSAQASECYSRAHVGR
jgi:hypothetical protein